MLKRLTHNLSLKLVALAIALAMWFFVVGQEKTEVYFRLRVELSKLPASMMVTNRVADQVIIGVAGPRTLVRRVAEQKWVKTVDLSGLREGEHKFAVRAEDLSLPRGVSVKRISPENVRVVLARLVERRLPVRPRFKGRPAKGFELGEVKFTPSQVTLRGVAEDIQDVDWIWTQRIDVTGRSQPLSIRVPLRMPGGRANELWPAAVQATVGIHSRAGGKPKSAQSKTGGGS